jgi:hypothetical protein
MRSWLVAVVGITVCGCGRFLGADFEVSEDPRVGLGDSCNESGALRCESNVLVMTCADGSWSRAFECPKGEQCKDQPDAQCIAEDIDCGATKGQEVCVGTTSVVCDENGRVAKTSDCPGPCVGAGVCLEVVDIAAGGSFTCALVSDKTVWCWGLNMSGELGHGTNFGSIDAPAAPARVDNLSGVVQVVAGTSFACARVEDGSLYCWGLNLVTGTAVPGYHIEKIPLPSPALEVGTNAAGACARMDGEVYCWGGNEGGQLCSGELTVAAGVVPELGGASALFMGIQDTCARFDDGRLECCGASDFPGDLSVMGPELHPTLEKVPGIPPVQQAALGEGSLCIEDTEGKVFCWGGNHFGQLCLGHTAYVDAPSLSFFDNASLLRMGGNNTLALDEAGNLTCCGYACGIPGLPYATTTPFLVLTEVTAVATGRGHTCAVFAHRALCWGTNSDGRIKPGLADSALIEPTLAGW